MNELQINNFELEKMIIANLIRNESFAFKTLQYLITKEYKKRSLFTDPKFQLVVNLLGIYQKKYKKMPTQDEMFVMVNKIQETEEQIIYIKKVIESAYELDVSAHIEFVEEETIKFIKQCRSVEAILLSQADIEMGKYDGIDKRLAEAININFDNDLGVSVRDFAKNLDMLKEVADETKTAYTGFPTVDRMIGGVQPGEMFIFGGASGGGKSLMLIQTAINAFQQGKKVVLFSLEMSEKRIVGRIYQSLFKRTVGQLLEGDLNEDVVNGYKNTSGDILIKQYGANRASANTFLSFMNDLKNIKHYEPDLIIVDYLGICSTNTKEISQDNTYKYYKLVSEELRNLAVVTQLPLFTAIQTNRGSLAENGGTKLLITARDIQDSKAILDTADYMIMLTQPIKEKNKFGDDVGIINLFVEKNRNGATSNLNPIKLQIDYKTLSLSEWHKS